MIWLALLSLILLAAACYEIAAGMARMTRIDSIPPTVQGNQPLVSIIIPACNEAATIEAGLTSVLNLDYPNKEIIVINDRSTDGTAAILRRMQRSFPHLKIITVTELPEEWLGKNHALHLGARHACGDFLLFTDADIIMEQTVLSRAMPHMQQSRLHHLSMFFKNTAPGGLLNTLLLDIGGILLMLFKPWRAPDPKSRYFMGVGAFNMLQTAAYKSIGGHTTFAMHPIDDIMLGKRVKEAGLRQECLIGYDFIRVKWYETIPELINGVMKNTFAVYNFSVPRVLAASCLVCTLTILPAWAALLTSGLTQFLFTAVVLVRMASFAFGFADLGMPVHYAIWSLVSPYLVLYINGKAALTTIKNKGINWRGTHYPLDKLKEQKIIP